MPRIEITVSVDIPDDARSWEEVTAPVTEAVHAAARRLVTKAVEATEEAMSPSAAAPVRFASPATSSPASARSATPATR